MDNGFFFNSGSPPAVPIHFDPAAWHSLSGQSPASILYPNWERPTNISHPLRLVPSPAGSNSNISGDIRELIGKLGTVCNSGEISPTSGNVPCITPPLNPGQSGPLISSQFPAMLSPSGGRSVNGRPNQTQLGPNQSSEFHHRSTPLIENAKLQRISSFPSLNPQLGHNHNQNQNPPIMQLQDQDQTQLANSREESTVSEQNPIGENQPNSRKRRSKVKDSAPTPSIKGVEPLEDSNPKKCKTVTEEEEEEKKKLIEPQKDYIHVRARRGQATDSHSLAERVRREKISERMRLLQDLVPGCNKVTGKALMLDEIINYVQSLQRQVEFLSMKLASVNTSIDYNMGSSTTKDVFGSNNSSMLQPMHTLDSSVLFGQNQAIQGLLDGFGEAASQHLTFTGDDLQSFVQMGFGQSRTLMSPNVQGSNQGCSGMKIEL